MKSAIRRAERLLPGEPAPPGAEDPRWQALIEIHYFIESDPDVVWSFVERWGGHAQEDLRTAVAVCLLEHLLEHHFELIFPRVRARAGRDRLFADMFSRCWKFGRAELPENARQFDELKASCTARRVKRRLRKRG